MSEDVGGPAVGVVGRLSHEDVSLLKEHGYGFRAGIEGGGHGEGEETQALLDPSGRVVELPEYGGQDDAGHEHGA